VTLHWDSGIAYVGAVVVVGGTLVDALVVVLVGGAEVVVEPVGAAFRLLLWTFHPSDCAPSPRKYEEAEPSPRRTQRK
jgi:hypothetical protein